MPRHSSRVKDARSASRPTGLRRGAYLLPSLFTIGNILLGYLAVVRALQGEFALAAMLVICASVLDGLDGRIARLTQTESDFGREFDSLADVLTFGLSPAMLYYLRGLDDYGRAGWLVPAFYLVCTATRLARFNVQNKVVDSRSFVGLPTPAAAVAAVSVLLLLPRDLEATWLVPSLMGILLLLGTLMVSTFRYPSFKKVDLRRRWSYRGALPLAAVLSVAIFHPPAFFFTVAALFTATGPILWLASKLRSRGTEGGVPEPSTRSTGDI